MSLGKPIPCARIPWDDPVVLRLIGAGLPRTGTSSLRDALSLLLDAPCYHMREAFAHAGHVPTWVAAIRGDPPDWHAFLDGYAAGVDTPFSSCWRSLAEAYPQTPVLLSRRSSAEAWFASMEPTVLAATRDYVTKGDAEDPIVPLFKVMFRDVITDLFDDDDVRAAHDRRLAAVRAEIAPERLVEWQPEDGWEPLCRALELPIPDSPFPHANTTADFVARNTERVQERAQGQERQA